MRRLLQLADNYVVAQFNKRFSEFKISSIREFDCGWQALHDAVMTTTERDFYQANHWETSGLGKRIYCYWNRHVELLESPIHTLITCHRMVSGKAPDNARAAEGAD